MRLISSFASCRLGLPNWFDPPLELLVKSAESCLKHDRYSASTSGELNNDSYCTEIQFHTSINYRLQCLWQFCEPHFIYLMRKLVIVQKWNHCVLQYKWSYKWKHHGLMRNDVALSTSPVITPFFLANEILRYHKMVSLALEINN